MPKPISYSVVVIGGGPAGMMAAAYAARAGGTVLLLEKNAGLGKKLLITGGGRCNVTNNKPVVREMLSQYKKEGKFLFSTFMQHGVQETMEWLQQRGVQLKEENEGRLFPVTEKAGTIQQALVRELSSAGVKVWKKAAVRTIQKSDNGFTIVLQNNTSVTCQRCIVATGGIARPETGSSGEGFDWLQTLGHTIVPNSYALVPVALASSWTAELSGLTVPECKLTIRAGGVKHSVHQGKVLFTHVGLTGPTILNLSATIGELLQYHQVEISLNLFPRDDGASLDQKLQHLFHTHANKKLRNALRAMLPAKLVEALLVQCAVDGDVQCNAVSRGVRLQLGNYLQAVVLPIQGLLSKDKAVVSAGGVALEEVNFKTMESRIVPGLFLVGDVLNINRPSGGYSLQLCWSTGAVAGTHAANDC